jgi:hypothetical protein
MHSQAELGNEAISASTHFLDFSVFVVGWVLICFDFLTIKFFSYVRSQAIKSHSRYQAPAW